MRVFRRQSPLFGQVVSRYPALPATVEDSDFMARPPNYSQQKQQREQAAKKKRDEKQQRRQEKKDEAPPPTGLAEGK
jgi:hypothetical protein